MIPFQLQQPQFRFIKVQENKAPIENNWQKNKNYAFNDKEILDFIEKNQRYGVVTGFGNLIVIDFDSKLIQDEVADKLPQTFSIKTAGKGLLHLYYITDNSESFKILDLNKNTLVDIQGRGKQVIGAGTILNGKRYEIVNDIAISNLNFSDIKIAFSKWLNIEADIKMRDSKETDTECKKIKEKIKVFDLLREYNCDVTKNPTSCPMHDSKGGRCFSYTDDTWHCFHCEQKGNIFHLFMSKNGCDFFEAKKSLAEKAGIMLQNDAKLKIDSYLDNVKKFYEIHPFFYDKNSIFWLWNNSKKMYEIKDDVDMMSLIDKELGFLGQTVSSGTKNNYLEAFKRVGRDKMPKAVPSKWIQFKDKAYSLRSNSIYEVKPNYFFCNPIPWEIAETSATPTIDKLFEEWVGKEYMQTLYEIIAYCCYTEYPMQLLFCFFGAGRNGKTCYMRLLEHFLGKDNICSTELDTLLDSRFESFKLYRKLACLMGETNFGVIAKTSILKKLVGGDMIGFEMKNKTPFNDYNYAKILISSNSLPVSTDTSEGFYRRWLIINWNNQFAEGKDILKTIPEDEYNNLARKVIEVLPKLLEKGEFTNQGTVDQRKQKFILSSNPLPLFINSFCCQEVDAFVSYGELYGAYVYYLHKIKKRRVLMKEFRAALEEEGFFIDKTAKKVDDEQWRHGQWVTGLGLLANWKKKLEEGDFLQFLHFFPNFPLTSHVRSKEVESCDKNAKKAQNEVEIIDIM